jgi:tetratricopeptide (TPR) repeat protein
MRQFFRSHVGLVGLGIGIIAGVGGTYALRQVDLGTATASAPAAASPANPSKPATPKYQPPPVTVTIPSVPADVLALLPRAAGKMVVDQALAQWTAKVEQNPLDDAAWAGLGEALMQKARETADTGYYTHAERAYAKALMLNPTQVTATAGLAWIYGCRHEFERSVDWANQTLTLDPQNVAAFGLLGDAAVEMGNYDTAFEHYQRMLDLRPDMSSYSRAAHLLYLMGNFRKAAWLMGKAIDASGPFAENTAWCRAQLALMHFGQGNILGAEQMLEEAVARTPNNYQVLAALGKVKAGRQDFPAAIAYYQKAVAIAPQIESLAALGDLYRLTGNEAEAEKQYGQVEAIHQIQKANGVRGDSQVALFYADHDRRPAEALRMVEEEYKTRKNVYTADALAWCYYKNGRYQEAKTAIRKALAKHTPEALFLFHAGMIHARLSDRVNAQLHLYQALSLNPNFSPIHAREAADGLQELGSRPPDAPSAAKAQSSGS